MRYTHWKDILVGMLQHVGSAHLSDTLAMLRGYCKTLSPAQKMAALMAFRCPRLVPLSGTQWSAICATCCCNNSNNNSNRDDALVINVSSTWREKCFLDRKSLSVGVLLGQAADFSSFFSVALFCFVRLWLWLVIRNKVKENLSWPKRPVSI